MKRWLVALLMICWLVGFLNADVLVDQNSNIQIERLGPAAVELELGAELLQKYLPRVLGRQGLEGTGAAVKFELEARAAAVSQLSASAVKDLGEIDGFAITIQSQPHAAIHIRGLTVVGVCMGIIDFLEKQAGITWLFPGELGVVIPPANRLVLREGEVTSKPAVISRVYSGIQGTVNLKFRQKYATEGKPLHGEKYFFEMDDVMKSYRLHPLLTCSHNMINIFPVKETKEKYPDLFPMKPDGTRHVPPEPVPGVKPGGPSQCWHPCYTNPKAAEIAIDKAKAQFSKGALIFSLGINDGRRVQCQCEECRKVGWPESYYQFVAKVAEAVKDQYPPRLIGVLIYGDVRQPTKPLKLPENVYAHVATGKFSEWAPRAWHIGRYNYFYGAGFWIPSFPLKAMQLEAKRAKEYGIKGFSAEVYPVWAFDAPKLYIHSRQLWNPGADVNALLERYCAAAFGKGGPAMARFYRQWTKRWDYLADGAGPEMPCLVDLGVWRNSQSQFMLAQAKDFAVSEACIEEARKLVTTGPETKRLEMVETHFAYAKLLFEFTDITQSVFSEGGQPDPVKVLTTLNEKAAKAAQVERAIQSHEEWRLCTKEPERTAGWTIENEIRSAGLTVLFRLREGSQWTEKDRAALPPSLKPYGAEILQTRPVTLTPRKDGTWYATAHNHLPMETTKTENGFQCKTIAEKAGPDAEEEDVIKKQWAFAVGAYQKQGDGRILLDFAVEARGRNGVLGIGIDNPWVSIESDGLPVNISLVFDSHGGAQKRRLVAEPVSPGSTTWKTGSIIRCTVLWTPRPGDSACEAVISAGSMQLEPEGAPN
ncbi:MAG: DUF4838 domain-containing protein [Verrucomicrobia bacterium]|nr:DUF4838 domain-containing protein [Verrucomicrobiota bacterium]